MQTFANECCLIVKFRALQQCASSVELKTYCRTTICSQKSASIQTITSRPKINFCFTIFRENNFHFRIKKIIFRAKHAFSIIFPPLNGQKLGSRRELPQRLRRRLPGRPARRPGLAAAIQRGRGELALEGRDARVLLPRLRTRLNKIE